MNKSVVSFAACVATCAITLCASVAYAETMKPGLWEFTTQMNGGGMPAMPKMSDAQRKQMEAMGIKMPQTSGGGIGITTKVCITPDQAKKGVPPSSGNDQEKCEQTDVKTSGKTTTWKMTCTGKHKVNGNGSVTYDSAEQFSGETTLNMEQGPQGVPAVMNNKYSGKFLTADCKQGK